MLMQRIMRRFFSLPKVRSLAHALYMRSGARSATIAHVARRPAMRVLVLGVYLSDRPHTASHLIREFSSGQGLEVEHRWAGLRGTTDDPELARATLFLVHQPTPKFALINRLISGLQLDAYDYIIVVDDDIHVRPGFLVEFLAYQRQLGFALAQPARTWHSHFDHGFVIRRPWLAARETRFVECGPMVSFDRDAARVLLPFDSESEMWGMDLVWPVLIQRAGLTMGIVDAVAVDHSLRGQATTYDRTQELAAMGAFLARTEHVPKAEVFNVLKRYPATWRLPYF
ncbi:MAG TPA: hypothetical protein VIP10_00695 [Burkholderiaceae bacterium]